MLSIASIASIRYNSYSIRGSVIIMAIYFTTRNIPKLKGLSLQERIACIAKASKKLTVPEKTFLNILKLVLLVPAFALVLKMSTDWTSLLWAGLIILLYPFLIKPMQYSIAAKYL